MDNSAVRYTAASPKKVSFFVHRSIDWLSFFDMLGSIVRLIDWLMHEECGELLEIPHVIFYVRTWVYWAEFLKILQSKNLTYVTMETS